MSSPLAPSSRPVSPVRGAGPGPLLLLRRVAVKRAVRPPPTSGGLEGKEEVVSSVLTSTDPILEADARKASEVANGNEEQTWRRERGR